EVLVPVPSSSIAFATVQERSTHFARRQMPKKNHQNEAVSSTKRSGSGLLNSGGRRGSKIPGSAQPWAADRDFTAGRRGELLCSTGLPHPVGLHGGPRFGRPQTGEKSNPPQAPDCDA